jgi:protein-glucosylgalactosylhydroxylysine glucosidase
MIKDIADFWASRATENKNGTYSVKNVVGADEFAHNVDNDAFTNGAVITALRLTGKAAAVLGYEPDPDWKRVANGIIIHKFPDGTTMEYSNYKGEVVKQADVNLLAYPLGIITDRESILRDLKYYESRLAPEGPAMGKSVLALIYARMGDSINAYRLFRRSYEPNKRQPFGVISESPLFENAYFVTGAGGMLQTILFGFGGLHLTDDGVIQSNPILPGNWKSLKIKGVGKNKKTFYVRR